MEEPAVVSSSSSSNSSSAAPIGGVADPYAVAQAAADRLRSFGVDEIDAVMVLGSGWAQGAALLGTPTVEVRTADLPGFHAPTVAGHGGLASLVEPAGRRILVLTGRTHLYEDRGVDAVVHGVRVAARLGAKVAVLTNGCGAVHVDWPAGTVALVSDHVNLTGTSPLSGPRFVDLSEVYSPRLRAAAHRCDGDLVDGVYVQLRGPQYETPAEVRMVRAIGGDLVGMSTALEAIAARAEGLEVLGVSLVTNPATGVAAGELSHHEVLAAGAAAAPRLGRLLAGLVAEL